MMNLPRGPFYLPPRQALCARGLGYKLNTPLLLRKPAVTGNTNRIIVEVSVAHQGIRKQLSC
jgi:hypothetical protein